MTNGEKIRELRHAFGLTQFEMADKTGIDAATIRKYETGKLNPKTGTLEKIARGLGIEPSILTESIMNTPRAMQRLFAIYAAYAGELKSGAEIKMELDAEKGNDEKIYVSFEKLAPFLYSWYQEYRKYQQLLANAKLINDEEVRKEYEDNVEKQFLLWMFKYPESASTNGQATPDTSDLQDTPLFGSSIMQPKKPRKPRKKKDSATE